MKQITILGAFLILFPLVAVGCDDSPSTTDKKSQVTSSDVRESLEETVETTGEFAEQRVAVYQKKIESQLQGLEEKHAKLMAQAKRAGADANAELQETLSNLERKKKEVLDKMDALKDSSGQALEDLEAGIDRALAELEAAYQKALTRYSDKA